MSNYPTMIIYKIDGIDKNALNLVRYEKDGKETWAIRNKFGKTSPFFENYFNPYAYNDTTLLAVGELEGKRELYMFDGSKFEEGRLYWKIPTEGELKSISEINDKVFKVRSSKGEYLLDRKGLRRKSDFFDNISCEDNRYLFEKKINYQDKDHIYFGEVNLEGRIKPFLYEIDTNRFIDTPLAPASGIPYDLLDTFALERKIKREDINRQDQFKSSIETLKKLNGDYRRR